MAKLGKHLSVGDYPLPLSRILHWRDSKTGLEGHRFPSCFPLFSAPSFPCFFSVLSHFLLMLTVKQPLLDVNILKKCIPLIMHINSSLKTSTWIKLYCIYSILLESKSSKCMSHISFTYSFGSVPLRNPGRLPVHSKQKSVLVNKGVSESKDINVNSKICFCISK